MAPNLIYRFGRPAQAKGKILTCHCEGLCPHEEGGSTTCQTRPGGSCFSSIEQILDDYSEEVEPLRMYGCMAPADGGGFLTCKLSMNTALHGMNIFCCDSGDFCNRDVHPEYKPRDTTKNLKEFSINPWLYSAIVPITLIAILAIVFIQRRRKRQSVRAAEKKAKLDQNENAQLSDFELSSGSGAGVTLLVQRTINKEIEFGTLIGQGRYGKVYLAKFRGEYVAAKVFSPSADESWSREAEIYQSVVMRHENIMGFIASDIDGAGQRILITHYHELGSLRDYLQSHSLTSEQLVGLAHSLAAGLAHLHTEISGSSGKPAIAHCDLNSCNILVKKDIKCAIADFGMAVKYISDQDSTELPTNSRVATVRYMAPECLNGTIDVGKIESYKMTDMYAVGLLLWEMGRCCETTFEKGSLVETEREEYSLPYQDMLPKEPTIEDIQAVVCAQADQTEGNRPPIPSRWENEDVLRVLKCIIMDCWKEKPSSRLTSLRVKKTLGKLHGTPDHQFLTNAAIDLSIRTV